VRLSEGSSRTASEYGDGSLNPACLVSVQGRRGSFRNSPSIAAVSAIWIAEAISGLTPLAPLIDNIVYGVGPLSRTSIMPLI
jgi:hypothetical protein